MIIDAHLDIAYNEWALGRDFFLPALDKRAREAGTNPAQKEDLCTVGVPDLQSAGVGLVIASIFTEPARSSDQRAGFVYTTPEEAEAQGTRQVECYRRICIDPRLMPITKRSDLDTLLQARTQRPLIGLMMEMEGADPILSPADVAVWWERGVRQVGLAWAYGSRYCGGNAQPGPLTPAGADLLHEMEDAGMILDVSHLAEQSFWQALAVFHGPIVASHANCRVLVPGERQLSDDMIKAIAERDGVIGVVLFNRFLKPGWTLEQGKQAVTLANVLQHIDHICQLAGNAQHVGIGSDLDGGFGTEATPAEIDTSADLRLLAPALIAAGYRDAVDGIMGGNWLHFLQRSLP
jgi:membrane dipeptidase